MLQQLNQSVNLLIPQYRNVGGAMMPISAPSTTSNVSKPFSSIIVEQGKRSFRMATQNILFVRTENVYCELYLCNHKRIVQRGPLSELQQQLPSSDFIRVHRSFLVNLSWVESWTKGELTIGKQRIPVSRTQWQQVVQRLRSRG
jgi:DNA-binding LytR/AlgR family response regulator